MRPGSDDRRAPDLRRRSVIAAKHRHRAGRREVPIGMGGRPRSLVNDGAITALRPTGRAEHEPGSWLAGTHAQQGLPALPRAIGVMAFSHSIFDTNRSWLSTSSTKLPTSATVEDRDADDIPPGPADPREQDGPRDQQPGRGDVDVARRGRLLGAELGPDEPGEEEERDARDQEREHDRRDPAGPAQPERQRQQDDLPDDRRGRPDDPGRARGEPGQHVLRNAVEAGLARATHPLGAEEDEPAQVQPDRERAARRAPAIG